MYTITLRNIYRTLFNSSHGRVIQNQGLFREKAIELSIELQKDLENLKERADSHNPQLILRKYKEIVAHEARIRQKCAVSMRQALADEAKEEQIKVYNDPNLDETTRKLEGEETWKIRCTRTQEP